MATEPLDNALETASGAAAVTLQALAQEAARQLADALVLLPVLHEPGNRDRHRVLLERAIACASAALADAGARSTLVRAHAEKARDARHGAGQLSRSAQRAPTREACEEGWRRVAEICAGAEASARVAVAVAAEIDAGARGSAVARAASKAARDAEAAASAARRVVAERNHAYTFHTDGGFSFGEGWYLAAAAVLAGVSVQIEPGRRGTPQAERFLRDAGLGGQLLPYRSRPRAMKQTTELVGRAFRADAASAQRRLRAAFLGPGGISREVSAWLDERLHAACAGVAGRKVLLWIRDGAHHPGRNTTLAELVELAALVRRAGLVPVLTGDALRGERVPEGVVDLILFWKDPIFQQADMRRAQLHFFEHLRRSHGLVGQVGVTTAGMDGPALMGLPTLYLTDAPNVRMREWVDAVPGYEEIVRASGYLERVGDRLSEWCGRVCGAPIAAHVGG